MDERDRRIAELEAENAKLRAENEELRRENAELRRQIEVLRKQVEEALRAQKRQAAPFSKGPPKETPRKPGRKPGKAYGLHVRREPPKHVDEVIRVPMPSRCNACGGEVEPEGIECQFQTEIPRKPIQRRFDLEMGKCRRCGRRVQGKHRLQTSEALGAAQAQLGPNAQAFTAILKDVVGVSYGDVREIFDKGFGIQVSRGGAARIVLRVGERLRTAYQGIGIVVRRSRQVSGDETGWKVAGVLNWMWTFAARTVSLFSIRPSRGRDVLEEILGAEYSGTLVHDGWAPYDAFEQARHQTCLAHLDRRCDRLRDTAPATTRRFPEAVQAILHRAFALRDRRDAGEISRHGVRIATGRLEWELYDLLMQPRRNPANRRFARHLGRHFEQLFTFLRIPGVAATSWWADHAMRRYVANRKIFGGNRTEAGARAQECMASVHATCRQRGIDFLTYLVRLLRARPEDREMLSCRLLMLPLPP